MTQNLTPEQLAYRLQFAHIEKTLGGWPGASDDANQAAIFGLAVADYQRIRAACVACGEDAARELLADPEFARQVDALPFAPGATVVAVGDSITDDWQSWFEILRGVLSLRRPADAIQLVNAGVSGETTAQVIARFLGVALLEPDWIVCFIGTNDARRHGLYPQKTLVSADETARNLRALRHFGATQTRARWAWITPATVDEQAIASHWFLGQQNQLGWRNADLAAIAEAIKEQPDPVVDLQAVFGVPPRAGYLMDAGLHPALDGQKAILRALVARLVGS